MFIFQQYYLSHSFSSLPVISLLLEVAGKTNTYVWKSIEHVSIVLQD